MTQQYLSGELSLRLAELQTVGADSGSLSEIVHLRHTTETGSITGLGTVLMRALQLIDGMCWTSLEQGDTVTFTREIDICAELCEFGIAAGILDDWNDPP